MRISLGGSNGLTQARKEGVNADLLALLGAEEGKVPVVAVPLGVVAVSSPGTLASASGTVPWSVACDAHWMASGQVAHDGDSGPPPAGRPCLWGSARPSCSAH